jgi:hypothetical protein
VIIFERSRKSGKEYVNVARAMQPGDVGPPQPIGWTWRGNLSSGTHEPTEPEVVDPEEPEDIPTVDPVVPSPGDIPGLPTMPEITHAAFTDIVAELERMEQNPVKIEKRHKEEIGDAREERVKEIGSVRKKIAALTAETLGVSAEELGQAKAYLYRRLAPLAPYYNQIANTNMLEQYEIENGEPVPIPDKPGEYVMVPGWQRTCNVTVPAMVVEGLGKTKDDYKNKGNLPLLRSIFDHLEGKYKKRKFYDAVSDFDSLRLPDFMTLIAISYRMPKGSDTLSDEAFNEALKTARQQAANKTVKHNVITSLVKAFDAKTEQHKIYPKQLEKIGSARRNYIRKVLLGEKIPSKVKKKYESVKADELLPVETYREAVLAEVNPLLDSGAQILVGMENHFVRLDALDEDTVMVDDPGFADLKNVRVTWEQARDMGFFKVFWAVRG